MLEREKSLSALIKEIKGMKQTNTDRVATALSILSERTTRLENAMESDVFRQAHETHMLSCGAYVTKSELDQAITYKTPELMLHLFVILLIGFIGGMLGAYYG